MFNYFGITFTFFEMIISTIGVISFFIAIICYVTSFNYRGIKLTDREANILFCIATFFLQLFA